jgi:hypothetical protein
MDALSTATARNKQHDVFRRADSCLAFPEMPLDSSVTPSKPKQVTESEYWDKYYDYADVIYEWNNGLLEEKPVSDHENVLMYLWFVELLREFLRVKRVANLTVLEMGFKMNLPHKTVIRKPYLGVVLNNNPIPLEAHDRSYKGVCDMCIEVVSDSKPEEIERDTDTKFAEYEAAGVKEYYILYTKGDAMAFYRLNRHGVYVPIKPVFGDVIQSQVLPCFQFRISDLLNQPTPEKMAFDSVYEKFVLPYYQAEKKARQAAEEKIKRLEAKMARLIKS